MKGLLSHRVAFDVLPDGVVVFDRETGVVLDANEQLCQMYGYAREELLALGVEDLCAAIPDAEPASAGQIIRQATTEGPTKRRWLARRKDGERFWIEAHLRQAELDGETCVVATLREIHALHEAAANHEADANGYDARAYTRLREVLRELPVYVFRQDRDLRYTWVSSTVPEVNAQTLPGKSDDVLLPDGEAARIRSVKRRVLETGEPARVEMQGTLSGQRRFFETHLVPERDAAGAITGLLGATIDVTERWEAEQAELESERRYRQLFEAAQDGIVIQSPEGEIIDINPAGLDVLGYRRDELEEVDWNAFVAESDQRVRIQELLREEGKIRNVELSLRRKDGTKIICLVSAAAQRDAGGRPQARYMIFRDITERKRQEKQFRLLVEEVKEYAIFMLDPTGCVITWNEGAASIKGYAEAEILGTHFSTFYTPEDVQAGVPDKGLETAARKGQWKHEGWRVRKDGTRFWAHVTITALHGEDDELRGFAKVTRDMTDRRRRERKLRRSEARYRRLFEESQEGIVISTPMGAVIDANPAAENILGYNREEMRAMEAQEMYVDPKEREKGVRLLTENGMLRDFEVRLRRKDEAAITCRLSATVRRGPDGKVEAFQTFFRDVTDEKRALQALRDSEERFRALAEKALVGIALLQRRTDKEGFQEVVYRYVNPAFARLAGYTPEEIVGQSPQMLFHPGDWPHVQDMLKKRFADETQEAHYEARIRTRSGEARIVEVLGSRFTYQDKPAIIGTIQDVTERRRLEKELLWVQEKERRRIGRELHDGVASELTGAGALTSVVSNKAKKGTPITPDEIDQIGALIKESSRAIRKLSRGLSPTELGAGLVPALKGLVRRTGGQREQACSFEPAGEAPDLSKETATHLYRIAQEAIQNAVRHAEARRIHVRYGMETDETLILEIRDDGHGGAEGAPFESTEGFGMRTMRYRANLIGGTLTVEEALEGGTIIRCRLPVHHFRLMDDSDE